MGIKLMAMVFDLDPKIYKCVYKSVLIALADHASEDGYGVWPSVSRLAHKTGLSDRAVQKMLRIMEEDGVIEMTREGGGSMSNEWRINCRVLEDRRTPFTRPVHEVHPTGEHGSPKSSLTPSESSKSLLPTGGNDANPKKSLNARQEAVSELEQKFSSISGIAMPKRVTIGDKKSAALRWWNPLGEIWELCDKNTGSAIRLMELAYKQLSTNKMTVHAPQSVLNTAIALHAQGNGGNRVIKLTGVVNA